MTAHASPASRRVARRRVHRSSQELFVGLVVVLVALVAFSWLMGRSSYDTFGAVMIAPVLVLLTIPTVIRSARREGDRIVRIVWLGLALKLVGAIARYNVAYDVYGGTADASTYHMLGAQLARSIHHGHFTVPSAPIGTQFIVVLTGVAYAVVGSTRLGGFFLFAWLGFLGQYLFYRAFRVGYPHGDRHRYAKLVFFLPSMVFWPSSLGKEAWMTLTLGMAAYGAARLLTRRRGAFGWLLLGLWGSAAVRPHVTLIVLAAIGVVYPLRRSGERRPVNPVVKVGGLLVLSAAAVLALQKASGFFGLQVLDPQSVTKVLDRTQSQTSVGGSVFTPVRVSNPLKFPGAFVTVLFRPFPTEAHNLQAVLAAAEGVFLVLLILVSGSRLRRLPREMLRTSYVLFAVVYVLAFVFAFSSIGNFGIIVRERVQVLPLLMVPLALAPVARPRGKRLSQSTTSTMSTTLSAQN